MSSNEYLANRIEEISNQKKQITEKTELLNEIKKIPTFEEYLKELNE